MQIGRVSALPQFGKLQSEGESSGNDRKDLQDRPTFQAAVVCDAIHLLTGDLKHFGYLMNRPDETFGVVVQTVSDFLDGLVDRDD